MVRLNIDGVEYDLPVTITPFDQVMTDHGLEPPSLTMSLAGQMAVRAFAADVILRAMAIIQETGFSALAYQTAFDEALAKWGIDGTPHG